MSANLTLDDLKFIKAAAFGINGNQASANLETLSKVILTYKDYIKSGLSTDILT